MTLYQFNVLEFNEKMEAVNQLGTFLDNYVIKEVKINCYAIDRFFVEVYYNSEHNAITDVTAFKTGKNLDKYLNL